MLRYVVPYSVQVLRPELMQDLVRAEGRASPQTTHEPRARLPPTFRQARGNTFPAAEHHRHLTSTNLYRLVTEASS